jgi:hypothetical protein
MVDRGDFQYSANPMRRGQYLSTNDNVNAQGGLGGGLCCAVGQPAAGAAVRVGENFSRQIRATN